MIISITHRDKKVDIDMDKGFDLSIPNCFNSKNPSFFNSKNPKLSYLSQPGFKASIAEGGSCNVPSIELDIHSTGTHTECVGHIRNTNTFINEVCPKSLISSTLITVSPDGGGDCHENYHAQYNKNDLLITQKSLSKAIDGRGEYLDALIIRTLPNTPEKKTRNYDEHPASFFSNDAITYLLDMGVKHLLVDLPSIDKANDNGLLGNHHLFFKGGETVSELLYIDKKLKDGHGFLFISIPNWVLDSAPSRPIFYPIS